MSEETIIECPSCGQSTPKRCIRPSAALTDEEVQRLRDRLARTYRAWRFCSRLLWFEREERAKEVRRLSTLPEAGDLKYLVEQAAEAEEFCGKICGHKPTDTIREIESEALALGHGLMIALNPFRAALQPQEQSGR